MWFGNKVVIITGGGSGIGEESSRRFAEEGASVVIADWNEADGERVVASINARFPEQGGIARASFIRTDVSKEQDVANLIAETLRAYGRIDVLVNNAAVILPRFIEEIEVPDFDRLISVNLKGVYLMTKYAIPHLRQSKGAIVNMASLNGLVGQKQNPIYAASKGGIIALTKSLALDFAADSVRVNCVCPAGVMTPLLEVWTQQQDDPAATAQVLNDMHPLGRPAKTAEVAQAILYLASGQSAFITGVALPVDGGASLGY